MQTKTVILIYNASHHLLLFKAELIESIKREGYKVVAITSRDKYTPILKEIVDDFYEINVDSFGTNPLKDLALTYQIFSICKYFKSSILLNFTIKPVIYGTLVGKLLSIPVINTITGLGTVFISKGLATKIVKVLYKLTLNYAVVNFFQNKDDLRLFIDSKIIYKNNTKLVSGSGVNLEKYVPTESKYSNSTIILFIGRIISDKGIYELIESAKIIKKDYKNVTFKIMGKIGVKNKTSIKEDQIKEWVDVGLIEYIPFQEDIREILGNSHVVILPSYREGTPKTLLEAASMAKPIIATDVPGCREVVVDGFNGFLCKSKNSISLANSIKQFIELENFEKVRMGHNSRIIAEDKFDLNFVNNSYLQEINSIIK